MYKIEIFGMPVSFPSEYELREAAIERTKRELATKEYPADEPRAEGLPQHGSNGS